MSLQIREKEQEEKLSDLKAKELKRQVPNNQLKPLRRNQSQSERNQNRNNSMIKGANSTNDSMIKARNASATRIPTVRAGKKKKLPKQAKMNMSVDVDPQTEVERKDSKLTQKLLNSSEDEMPDENTHQKSQTIAKEVSLSDVKKGQNSNGYKGYTPTGILANKALKAPLPPQVPDKKFKSIGEEGEEFYENDD